MHELLPLDAPLVDAALNEPPLTAAQVAELLSVPTSSVYACARRRHAPLPSISIGKHRRFYRGAVRAWLQDLRHRGG